MIRAIEARVGRWYVESQDPVLLTWSALSPDGPGYTSYEDALISLRRLETIPGEALRIKEVTS